MKSNKPTAIIRTKLLPSSVGGFTLGTFVFIQPELHNEVAIIEHEKVHVRQFREDRLMPIKYLLSRRKRLEYELEAYAVSVANGVDIDSAVDGLFKLYSFGMSRKLLKLKLREVICNL